MTNLIGDKRLKIQSSLSTNSINEPASEITATNDVTVELFSAIAIQR